MTDILNLTQVNQITLIPAIVLTFDQNRVLTKNMIMCYNKLWPDHPFEFIVPYQINDDPFAENVKFVKTDPEIKPTVLTLLSLFNSEDWIFWCIDDKYPIELDKESYVHFTDMIISNSFNSNIAGILLCRARALINQENLELTKKLLLNRDTLIQRKSWHHIWIHQFIRVHVLKSLFSSFPDHIEKAKDMDEFKWNCKMPKYSSLFVSEKNHSIFGESSSRGVITKNCYYSLKSNNLLEQNKLPVNKKNLIIGQL